MQKVNGRKLRVGLVPTVIATLGSYVGTGCEYVWRNTRILTTEMMARVDALSRIGVTGILALWTMERCRALSWVGIRFGFSPR